MCRGSLSRQSVFLLLSAWCSIAASNKQYRTDYVYNKQNDAFYKLHTESVEYERAQRICDVEGAALMIIDSIFDTVFVHGLLKDFPDIGNYVWVGENGDVHESVDEETPILDYPSNEYAPHKCSVLNRQGIIQEHLCHFSSLPFVCKVAAKDAPYDATCQVYAKGYKYVESVGSCYKIPRIVFKWAEAEVECRAQGAHLVVLNSEAERAAVQAIMTSTLYLEDSHSKYYYMAGIRALPNSHPRVFLTVLNQTLEEAGFNKWADTEPNNYRNSEDCGSLYESDGKYNDQNCNDVYGFICEKEKKLA